jgi:hypothetical protein
MAVVISPLYPDVGDVVTLTIDNATGSHVAFEIVSVPTDGLTVPGLVLDGGAGQFARSKLQGADDTSALQGSDTDTLAILVSEGKLTNQQTFLTAGEYSIKAFDLRVWNQPPSFGGDPSGTLRSKLISVQSTTVHIGKTVDLFVGAGSDGATLRLQVNDSTVRVASLVNPTTDVATSAAAQTTVAAALTALVGSTVTAAGNNLLTATENLRDNYEAHRVDVSGGTPIHDAADTTNAIVSGDGTINSIDAAIAVMNELLVTMIKHFTDGSAAAVPWHSPAAGDEDDLENLPVASAASDLASGTVLLADLRERCYERHRQSVTALPPDVHGSVDSGNALSANTKLDDLIVAFLDAIVKQSMTNERDEPQGVIDAAALYGFKTT